MNRWTLDHRSRPVPPEKESLLQRDQVPRYQMGQVCEGEGGARLVVEVVGMWAWVG